MTATEVTRIVVTSLGLGSHQISADYSGDTHFKSSTGAAVTQVVNQASSNTVLSSSAKNTVVFSKLSGLRTV